MPLCSRIPQLGYDAIRYAAERYNSAPMLRILLQHGGNPNGGECAGNPVRRASVCVRACVCVCVCACVCVCGYGCVASYACLCIGISTGAHAVDVRCVAWTSCIGSPAAGARGECEHSKRGTRVHAAATAAGWAVKCTVCVPCMMHGNAWILSCCMMRCAV